MDKVHIATTQNLSDIQSDLPMSRKVKSDGLPLLLVVDVCYGLARLVRHMRPQN